MTDKPRFPEIGMDHDERIVTFAVSFAWREPWAFDGCEVATLRGWLARTLPHLMEEADWHNQVASILAIETWDPLEERHIGDPDRLPPLHLVHPDDVRETVHLNTGGVG